MEQPLHFDSCLAATCFRPRRGRKLFIEMPFNLFTVVDEPQQAFDEIMKFYKHRDMLPTVEERDKLLHL